MALTFNVELFELEEPGKGFTGKISIDRRKTLCVAERDNGKAMIVLPDQGYNVKESYADVHQWFAKGAA